MIVPLNKFIEEKSKFSLPRTSFSPVSPSNVIIFYIQSFFESSRYHQRIVPPFPRRPGAPKHQTNYSSTTFLTLFRLVISTLHHCSSNLVMARTRATPAAKRGLGGPKVIESGSKGVAKVSDAVTCYSAVELCD